MRSFRSFRPRFRPSGIVLSLATVLALTNPVVAQEEAEDPGVTVPSFRVSVYDWFSLPEHLVLEPMAIGLARDGDATVGLGYHYRRPIGGRMNLGSLGLESHVDSNGLFVPDKSDTPNRLFEHKLHLDVVNRAGIGSRTLDQGERERLRRIAVHYQRWQTLAQKDDRTPEESREMNSLFDEAQEYVEDRFNRLDVEGGTWNGWEDARSADSRNRIAASLGFRAGMETDQDMSNRQFVVEALTRWKILDNWLDFPFAMIRGYKTPRRYQNREGGPEFIAGIGFVDPQHNRRRDRFTGDRDSYGRVEIGLTHRAELFPLPNFDNDGGVTNDNTVRTVDLEFSWRYLWEIDPSRGSKRADLDKTSFVRARLIFPGRVFIEYTDGRLPMDIERNSSLRLGFTCDF